ncbi:MAG: 2-hydroxyacid dehydrogenase [Bacilli bacterium]|jgi:D-lactate dehydrogenase|nr:2-hydroxyacid dehydrogenase [Bacilli bacterium]MDY0363301.1 2-hydroxyacid dehydrogenase [Bacilli bacterium]
MKKITFFDTKPYDIHSFDALNKNFIINYLPEKLTRQTVYLAKGSDAICVFVNDTIDSFVIDKLIEMGVKLIALRSAGFNHVDLKTASNKLPIVRVPAYSPYAVAEHAMALLLTLNRKIHKAYARTKEFNFSLNGLMGFDFYNKTIGILGTGRIGQILIKIAKGFGMNVIAYDLYQNPNLDVQYVTLDDLLSKSDMISVHLPLTEQTKHLINDETINKMKKGVYLVNTSRGGVINTEALIRGLKNEIIKGAGLDVYEEETNLFFEDMSDTIIQDDILSILVNMPNVILTSHQAFLTEEALSNIAKTTLSNIESFFKDGTINNEVCYLCKN